ncbi:hypothetical protein [Porphyrobacter sp. YT40]|uniref:hypothetical protein n=1 Tax=Porphyrobacter sp. YT40 TaxID=2547601 RepID=UPI0011446A76|nr:hypothetical protein [Porphyrobacter sp. YT40]QDH34084.1 hypothetical protein E2E27_06900 [Porphyrobacter sp. YT40]
MTVKSLFTGLAALLCALVVIPAMAQDQFTPPAGPWLHEASGAQFPDSATGLERKNVTEFDDTGANVGVTYRAQSGPYVTLVDVFVYPQSPETSCAEEFEGVEQAIRRYKGLQTLSKGMTLAPNGTGDLVAHRARYLIPAGAMREGIPELTSEAYLHCTADGAWLVKYRASWSGPAENFPDLSPFLKALALSPALGGPN